MTAVAQDLLSEQLIAQLLESDLLFLESAKQAEKFQLDQVLAVSARAQGRVPKYSKETLGSITSDSDVDLAFELYVSDALASNDAAYAQAIQSETHAIDTVDRQYALKVAAAERKFNLDAEFARRLQELDDSGNVDIDQVKDAERILGDHAVSVDLNASKDSLGKEPRGSHPKIEDYAAGVKVEDVEMRFTQVDVEPRASLKGKGRQLPSPDNFDIETKRMRYDFSSGEVQIKTEESAPLAIHSPYPICGICLEPFLETHSPIKATLSANSSNKLPFGLRLPCPQAHAYCIACLTSYIQSKLDPDGRGVGKSSTIVFPIRCPECSLSEWAEGIPDGVAERVLGENDMVHWHHQKILDSIPRLFCPNPKCSSLVEADEDSDDPQAICPSCKQVMCVPCRALWHDGLTCEAYQALPLDERSPEDRLLLELAKAKSWRRCPSCSVIVEHISGCNHMTCRCGFHFCFKCESPTTKEGKCKRQPPCELWDEELLLEERERARNPLQAVPRPQAVAPAPPIFHAPPPAYARQDPAYSEDLAWMDDPNVLCGRHWFTANMISSLTCGYCELPLNSLADLRYHLAHVQRHGVYTCCGRFFKRRLDFERHDASHHGGRFGRRHAYRMTHD
ncbi:ATP-dependent RNA helicase DEAH12, chloroplastic [Hypsizygus marmoreus]|uniref:RBR-type E3 ubiquitin transferase n=1 Tax=Hypsizygus marmoreus TaxID=39966 RepID=A0A369K9U6_HYPMA|nr:ATP-dependent RNA helicase DEAH12, chloroplastic [Hypsizygus marmoreus]